MTRSMEYKKLTVRELSRKLEQIGDFSSCIVFTHSEFMYEQHYCLRNRVTYKDNNNMAKPTKRKNTRNNKTQNQTETKTTHPSVIDVNEHLCVVYSQICCRPRNTVNETTRQKYMWG